MTPGPIDDGRIHRGDSDLVDADAGPIDSPAREIAPPPVANSDMAARVEAIRAERGQVSEEEVEIDPGPREFVGDLPPLPPPPAPPPDDTAAAHESGEPRQLTSADEPDDPAPPPPTGLPDDDEGDAGPWSHPDAAPSPAVGTDAIADDDSWLGPRTDER